MIAQIGPLAELVAAEALRHLPAVIRKKEDRQEAVDHSRSKTRNQRWIDFLRSTRVEFWHTGRGIAPAPERGKSMSWSTFLKAHWGAIAATDLFTVEVVNPFGLVRYHVLFVIPNS